MCQPHQNRCFFSSSMVSVSSHPVSLPCPSSLSCLELRHHLLSERSNHCPQGNMNSKCNRPECLHFTWTCSRARVGKCSLHVSHSWNFTSVNKAKNSNVCSQGLQQETFWTRALSILQQHHKHIERSIFGEKAGKEEAKSK